MIFPPRAQSAFLSRLLAFAQKLSDAAQRDAAPPNGNAAPLGHDPDPLKGLRALDPEVITAVHNEYFPAIFRYARYRLSDDVLAEDVASEVFTRLLEHVHRGKGPRENLRGWLMRTASNLVNDYYRVQYARPTEELSEMHPADQPGPAAAALASEEQSELHAALKNLTAEQQEVLALRFGSGLSVADTAAVMGKNDNAIKALQFRAVAALRRQLVGEA